MSSFMYSESRWSLLIAIRVQHQIIIDSTMYVYIYIYVHIDIYIHLCNRGGAN